LDKSYDISKTNKEVA